jgi:hypothetical protein
LAQLDKASGGKTIWRQTQSAWRPNNLEVRQFSMA